MPTAPRADLTGTSREYVGRQGPLPLRVVVQGDGMLIVRNMGTQRIDDGSESLTLGGLSSNAILDRLHDHLAVDGAIWSGLEYRLASNANSLFRVYPQVIGFANEYTLAIRDVIGELSAIGE